MSDNTWYNLNKPMVDGLIYKLKELKLKGTISHEINPDSVVSVLNALVKENCDLTSKLNLLETKSKDSEKILEEILNKKEIKKEKRSMD